MKKRDLNIIKSIQAEAWTKFGDKLFVEKDVAPTVKLIAEKALDEEAHLFTDAQRGKIRAALETGEFDKRIKVEDEKVAAAYEKFVAKRIKEEIKSGRLSKPPKEKKVKQYARRTKRANA